VKPVAAPRHPPQALHAFCTKSSVSPRRSDLLGRLMLRAANLFAN